MAKEYVDREALYNKLHTADFDCYEDHAMAENIVFLFPAADVAPVMHARWDIKKHPPGLPEWAIRIMCSNCGLQTSQVSNYCPSCGAKMDLEGRNG